MVVWGNGFRAQDTKPSVPPVNTVPHGGRMELSWRERRGLGLRAKPVIPLVNTAPPGSQMECLCAKSRGLELKTQNPLFVRSTQHHLVVRWKVLWGKGRGLELRAKPSIPPINQVLHGGQMEKIVTKEAGLRVQSQTSYSTSQHSATWWSDGKFGKKEAGLRAQSRTLYSTSEHTITWWSDGKLVKKEAGFRAQSRTLYFTSEHSTTWWSDGKLWGGLELRAEPTLYFTSEHSTTWWSDGKFCEERSGA